MQVSYGRKSLTNKDTTQLGDQLLQKQTAGRTQHLKQYQWWQRNGQHFGWHPALGEQLFSGIESLEHGLCLSEEWVLSRQWDVTKIQMPCWYKSTRFLHIVVGEWKRKRKRGLGQMQKKDTICHSFLYIDKNCDCNWNRLWRWKWRIVKHYPFASL